MKTVGEFKKAGVVFVKGDLIYGHTNNKKSEPYDPFRFYGDICNWSLMWTMRSFAWRDLTTKPDNPQYQIELDIDNHRWRPSLNQDVAPVNPTEFKVGDLVDIHFPEGTYRENMEIVYIDDTFINAISIDEGTPFTKLRKNITVKRNDRLNELKDIIGTHDDPTECAKAILAAGYKK